MKTKFTSEYTIPALNYNMISEKLDLDKNDEITRSYTVPIPENLATGLYRLAIETYYDTNERSTNDVALLRKEECKAIPVKEPEKIQQEIILIAQPVTPSVEQKPEVSEPTPPADTVPPADKGAESFESFNILGNNTVLIVLIVAYFAILVFGAVVAFRLIKK